MCLQMYLLSHFTANCNLSNLAIFTSKTCKNLLQKKQRVSTKVYKIITLIVVNFYMYRLSFVAIFGEVTETCRRFTTISVINSYIFISSFRFYSHSEVSVHEHEIFNINIKEYSKNVTW
jgi:hypothetical protein